jgi:hypothetical protein
MNILCQGSIFMAGPIALQGYTGPHDLRVMVGHHELTGAPHHIAYDFEHDTLTDILAHLGDWQPDLIMFWQPEDQPPPRGTEDAPCRTLAIPSDWNHAFPRLKGNLGRFDVVACDRPGVTALQSAGIAAHWFGPVYAHQPHFHQHLNLPRDIDVLYAGALNAALRPRRAAFLERLEALKGRHHVVIQGDVYGEEYVRLLNRARLVFNHSVRGELNLRTFESWACGGVQLLEAENEEGQALLQDRETVVFYDGDNFEKVIETLLEDDALQETIRRRQFDLAETYEPHNRIDTLVDWAFAQPESGRPWHALSQQEQALHDVMALTDSFLPPVTREEHRRMAAYVQEYSDDPRAWTVVAKFLLTPYLHLFLECPDTDRRKGPVREALLKAADRAPNDAVHQMNAAWGCAFAGDDQGRLRALEAAQRAGEMNAPELLIGGVTDPFWAHWMQQTARGRARLEDLKAEATKQCAEAELEWT